MNRLKKYKMIKVTLIVIKNNNIKNVSDQIILNNLKKRINKNIHKFYKKIKIPNKNKNNTIQKN